MLSFTKTSLAAALCAATAMTALPAQAGVMSVTDKASVSLTSSTDQVHWRPYCHRHYRWRHGWHYGWRRHYGYYPGWRYYGYYPRWRYGYYRPYYGAYWGFNPVGAALAAPLWGTGLALGALASPWWW